MNMHRRQKPPRYLRSLAFAALLLAGTASSLASPAPTTAGIGLWPQWGGFGRDFLVEGVALAKDWSARQPHLV